MRQLSAMTAKAQAGIRPAQTAEDRDPRRLLSPWLDEPWRQLLALDSRQAQAVAIQSMPGLGAELLIEDFIRERFCEHPRQDACASGNLQEDPCASGNLQEDPCASEDLQEDPCASRSPADIERRATVSRLGRACRHCRACRWLESPAHFRHPDLRRLRPDAEEDGEEGSDFEPAGDDEGQGTPAMSKAETGSTGEPQGASVAAKNAPRRSREIRIEQVRALSNFLQTGSHRGRGKVVWISSAEAMNFAAANALLKALEEPAAQCLFILSCENLARLMPTIRSRCIQLRVRPPTVSQAQAALDTIHPDTALRAFALGLAGFAPWGASDRARGPLLALQEQWLQTLADLPEDWFSQLADAWSQERPSHWFEVLERWAVDLLCSAQGLEIVYFPHLAKLALQRAGPDHTEALFALLHTLQDMKRLLNHPLNPRLFAESALIHYGQACKQAQGSSRTPSRC